MTENDVSDIPRDSPALPSSPPAALPARLKMHPIGFTLLALAAIFFLYQIVGGGLTLLLFGQSVTQENVQWMRLSTMVAQVLFLLLPTLALMEMQHGTFRSVIPWRLPKTSEVVLTLVGVFSLQQAMEGYLFFQDKIPLPESLRPFVEQVRRMIEETYALLVRAHSVPELFYVVLVVALTPAICEEILFRGLIQTNMSHATGKKAGFILTGLIFGLYHVNPFLLVPLVVLGAFFGFLMYRSGTILLPMLAHFTNNVVSVLGAYGETDAKSGGAASMFNSLIEFSSSFVLSTSIGFALVFLVSMYIYFQVTVRIQSTKNVGPAA